jgi:hypothetical protein
VKLIASLMLGSSLCVVLSASPALASKVALVIGNADYVGSPSLTNPVKDARIVADTLEALGFEVILAENVKQREFADVLMKFEAELEGAEVAAFYYAGHGIQYEGQNYLVSVDAELDNPFMLQGEAMGLDVVIETMEAHVAVNMLFIDACRRNQFGAQLVRGPTPVAEGLAPPDTAGRDTLVMYATGPNEVAFDGQGSNSPFAQALVQHLPAPDTEIGIAMKRVIRDVRDATDGLQSPQMLTTAAQELYLKISPEVVPAALLRGDELIAANSSEQEAMRRLEALFAEGHAHRVADRRPEYLTAFLNARNLAAWYFGENSLQYARASNHLVGALTEMRMLPDAIYASTEAIRVFSLLEGRASIAVLNEKNMLAGRLNMVGRHDAARALLEEVIETFETTRRAKDSPALYAYVLGRYAKQLWDYSRDRRALEWADRAMAVEIPASSATSELYAHVLIDHADFLVSIGSCEDAQGYAAAAAKIYAGAGYQESHEILRHARGLANRSC